MTRLCQKPQAKTMDLGEFPALFWLTKFILWSKNVH